MKMIQPREILDEIKKRPPLQRVDAEKSYRGIKVSWKLKFKTAREVFGEQGKWEIVSEPEDNIYPDIFIKVDKGSYPEFNILHENSIFWVDGEISKVDGFVIHLISPGIRFSENKKESKPAPASNTFVNSQVHFGHGDNIGGDKNVTKITTKQNKWWEKSWVQIIIFLAALVAIIEFLILLKK